MVGCFETLGNQESDSVTDRASGCGVRAEQDRIESPILREARTYMIPSYKLCPYNLIAPLPLSPLYIVCLSVLLVKSKCFLYRDGASIRN